MKLVDQSKLSQLTTLRADLASEKSTLAEEIRTLKSSLNEEKDRLKIQNSHLNALMLEKIQFQDIVLTSYVLLSISLKFYC